MVIAGPGDFPGWVARGYGLMVTRDGGANWTNVLREELKSYAVSNIVFDPDDPNVIVVTAGRHPHGIRSLMYRSEDGGRRWDIVPVAPGTRVDWTDVQVSKEYAPGKRYYYAAGVRAGNELVLYPF
jgi:hypothetical protein